MKDDTSNEWMKLVTAAHIEVATKNVRRLSIALHISFLTKYMSTLSEEKSTKLRGDMISMETHEMK